MLFPKKSVKEVLLSCKLPIVLCLCLLVNGCVSTSDHLPVQTASDSTQSTARDDVEIKGSSDPALLRAAQRVVASLEDIEELATLSAETGLLIYPLYSCEPNVLKLDSMTTASLTESFAVANCHEPDPANWLRLTWGEFFKGLRATAALQSTDRIDLNQRYGIGLDTGTSYLAEMKFPAQTHQLAIYFNLGTGKAVSRDWDEVGFVFDSSGAELKLVAIYRDQFSAD